MSNRTIVEFNHDYTHEIRTDRGSFVSLLIAALNSGSEPEWQALEPYGVRRAVMAHHSDERSVLVNDRKYDLR